jgi:nicotinate-nucleotide adenylyltransferase
VLATGRADQVWLVPCFNHPFGKALAPFEHRHRMCELVAECFAPGLVQVSRVEQDLGGESRTLFTIQRLVADFPEKRFSLVIGADILAEKQAWHRFDAIEQLVDVVVVGRGGFPPPPDGSELVLPEVSSSEIRQRIRDGHDASDLVPAAVLRYIAQHGLYKP